MWPPSVVNRLITEARAVATGYGVPFGCFGPEDVPEILRCPALRVLLDFTQRGRDRSACLVPIHWETGYVKGNLVLLSNQAFCLFLAHLRAQWTEQTVRDPEVVDMISRMHEQDVMWALTGPRLAAV